MNTSAKQAIYIKVYFKSEEVRTTLRNKYNNGKTFSYTSNTEL